MAAEDTATTAEAGGSDTTEASGGADTTEAAEGTETTEAAAEDFDPNGVMRVGVNFLRSGTYSFDSRLYAGSNRSVWMFALFAPIVKVDPRTLEYTPYLAESFEVVDPQSLPVILRDDATFHDGWPVTSADAKATIEAEKVNQGEATSNVSASIQRVESVEVVDDRTFTVKFSRPAVLTMYELMAGPEFLISPPQEQRKTATRSAMDRSSSCRASRTRASVREESGVLRRRRRPVRRSGVREPD